MGDAQLGPAAVDEFGLFDNEHRKLRGHSGHEMLWALPDEAPTQMGETEQSRAGRK